MKVRVGPMDIDVSVKDLAVAFWRLGSDEQADFFVELGREVDAEAIKNTLPYCWPSMQFYYVSKRLEKMFEEAVAGTEEWSAAYRASTIIRDIAGDIIDADVRMAHRSAIWSAAGVAKGFVSETALRAILTLEDKP